MGYRTRQKRAAREKAAEMTRRDEAAARHSADVAFWLDSVLADLADPTIPKPFAWRQTGVDPVAHLFGKAEPDGYP